MPQFHTEYLEIGGDGNGPVKLKVRSVGGLFYLVCKPDDISAPGLFKKYLQLANDYLECDWPSPTGERIEELIEPFKLKMEEIASGLVQGYLLSNHLYPETFVLEARAGPEETKITPENIGPKYWEDDVPGAYLLQWAEQEGPAGWKSRVYSSTQVYLPHPADANTRLSVPKKIFIHDEAYSFILVRSCENPCTYEQILEDNTTAEERNGLLDRLHGVVVDGGNETSGTEPRDTSQRVVGLLVTLHGDEQGEVDGVSVPQGP